ncbi:hypothetical protein FQZ97_666950 [compost metagenome]
MIAMVDSVSGSSSSAPLRMAALRIARSSSVLSGACGAAGAAAVAAVTATAAGTAAAMSSARCENCAAEASRPSELRTSIRKSRSGSDCTPSASHMHTAISYASCRDSALFSSPATEASDTRFISTSW